MSQGQVLTLGLGGTTSSWEDNLGITQLTDFVLAGDWTSNAITGPIPIIAGPNYNPAETGVTLLGPGTFEIGETGLYHIIVKSPIDDSATGNLRVQLRDEFLNILIEDFSVRNNILYNMFTHFIGPIAGGTSITLSGQTDFSGLDVTISATLAGGFKLYVMKI